jgi:hypothetical protein
MPYGYFSWDHTEMLVTGERRDEHRISFCSLLPIALVALHWISK